MKKLVLIVFAATLAAGTALAGVPTKKAEGGFTPMTAQAQTICAARHGNNDFWDLWKSKKCSASPYGPAFEHLRPAWLCFCGKGG
jgi:hypothetical protein